MVYRPVSNADPCGLLFVAQAGPALSDLERLFPASATKVAPRDEASDLDRLFPSSGGDTEEDVEARLVCTRLLLLSTRTFCICRTPVWASRHSRHHCEIVGTRTGAVIGS